jgi:hypothetical protein
VETENVTPDNVTPTLELEAGNTEQESGNDVRLTPARSDVRITSEDSDSEHEGASEPRRDPPTRIQKDHPASQVIGELTERVRTRNRERLDYRDMVKLCVCMNFTCTVDNASCFVSTIEPKNVNEALLDNFWINAMQDELLQFTKNNVWILVPRPPNVNVIGTKWIFKNKSNEEGVIVRNKARLVAQGYTQVEGVDFDETFAPVARIESIRLLLAIACCLKIKLYQMDVKGAFLNGLIDKEVYVEQPKGFTDPKYPNHVYKLEKALYGLKQAPRAWYERLTEFLLSLGFVRGGGDRTLFVLKKDSHICIAQIYVDDIVFGSTNNSMLEKFVESMTGQFEMSMMGELNFFLGLQVKQTGTGIFLCQEKYAKNLVKRFELADSKPCKTPWHLQ